MSKYYIELPYTGVMKVEVVAETKEEALSKVMEADKVNAQIISNEDIECIETEEEYHELIMQGSSFTGVQNKLYVEKIEEEADE